MAIKYVTKEPERLIDEDVCPKCQGNAWYEVTDHDIVQRCVCGLLRYVWLRLPEGGYRTHIQRQEEFKLPDRGTKLSMCLGHVVSCYPNTVTTKDLCISSGQSTSDVSSQLIVLMHKGLVERVEARPGTRGGSIWRVTRRALSALGVEHGG